MAVSRFVAVPVVDDHGIPGRGVTRNDVLDPAVGRRENARTFAHRIVHALVGG